MIEGRDQVDWKRHGVFVTFGFFYLVRLDSAANRGLGLPAVISSVPSYRVSIASLEPAYCASMPTCKGGGSLRETIPSI